MYLSACVVRNKKFFYFFGKRQKALARFCLALVSYSCIIQVYYRGVKFAYINISFCHKDTKKILFFNGRGRKE